MAKVVSGSTDLRMDVYFPLWPGVAIRDLLSQPEIVPFIISDGPAAVVDMDMHATVSETREALVFPDLESPAMLRIDAARRANEAAIDREIVSIRGADAHSSASECCVPPSSASFDGLKLDKLLRTCNPVKILMHKRLPRCNPVLTR
jgi:hypothetical protein